MFGEVFKLMQAEEPPRTPLQKSMDILGKQLTIYSLAVIGIIMAIGWLQGRPILDMFNVGVSLAVAAIPEGLPIVVTVTLAFGVMRMAKKNAVVKRLPTVEALGCVDWICSDKTGTLTSNEQTVANCLIPSDVLSDEHVSKRVLGGQHDAHELQKLLEVANLCNNATPTTGAQLERALLSLVFSKGRGDLRENFPRMNEIPFSSERKYMAVSCQVGSDGQEMHYLKGAPEEMMEKCQIVRYNDSLVTLSDHHKRKIFEVVNWLGNHEYKRVLALGRGNDVNRIEFVGLVAFIDPPRPGE